MTSSISTLRNRPWFLVSLRLKRRLLYFILYLGVMSLCASYSLSSIRAAICATFSSPTSKSDIPSHLVHRVWKSAFFALVRMESSSKAGLAGLWVISAASLFCRPPPLVFTPFP